MTSFVLYGYLIPISLYVSLEMVKVVQSLLINQDRAMYHTESDTPAKVSCDSFSQREKCGRPAVIRAVRFSHASQASSLDTHVLSCWTSKAVLAEVLCTFGALLPSVHRAAEKPTTTAHLICAQLLLLPPTQRQELYAAGAHI